MKPILPLVLLLAVASPALRAAPTSDERLQQALDRLAPVCLEAKKPADLDAILVSLSDQSSSGDPVLASRRQAAVSFLRKWREYLEADSKDNAQRATEILRSLCQDDSWVGLLPRSQVLDRYTYAKRTQWVHYETRTLEDLPIAVRKLEAFNERVGLGYTGKKVLEALKQLDQYRATIDQENAPAIVALCLPEDRDDAVVVQFKSLLLARVVSRYLDLPPEYRLKPTPTETAPLYLQRVMDLATERRDLVTLWRTRNFSNKLTDARYASWQRAEIEALDRCLTARKDEAEGRRPQALVSYLSVLQCRAGSVPLAIATERIRASDPAALKAAQSLRDRELYEAQRRRMGMRPEPNPFPGQESEQPWLKY